MTARKGCLLILGLLVAAGCGGEKGPSRPVARTVGNLRVVRGPVRLGTGGEVSGSRRLADGAQVSVGEGGRALVSLDRGALLLLDAGARLRVEQARLRLESGRIFARTAAVLELETREGKVRAESASFEVASAGGGVQVTCVTGEVFLQPKGAKEFRPLGHGTAALLAGGKVKLLPDAVWSDWTSGMAGRAGPEEGPRLGLLEGRPQGAAGQAPRPLVLREHEVEVTVDRSFAWTRVTQVYFNPYPWDAEGFYQVALPEGAILGKVSYGRQAESLQVAAVVPRARRSGRIPAFLLEQTGPGSYLGRVGSIPAGSIFVVRLEFGQWLERRAGRLVYRYPMGGDREPNVSEFQLRVRLLGAEPKDGLRASQGAVVKGRTVSLVRSDFRPRSDFILEIPHQGRAEAEAWMGTETPRGGRSLLLRIWPPLSQEREHLDVMIVVDRSARATPAEMQLAGEAVASVLDQLKPGDRVGLLAASQDVLDLGKGLGPATAERRKQLLEALGRLRPEGATDLGLALSEGLRRLPKGRGVLVYVGDGRPTTGAMEADTLRRAILRVEPAPRIFALLVGGQDRRGVLAEVLGGGRFVLPVQTREEAAAAAFEILSEAIRPDLRGVRVALDGDVEQVYPAHEVVVTSAEPLLVFGRLPKGGKRPTQVVVTGSADGKPFRKVYRLSFRKLRDHGDLARRWAQARIQELVLQTRTRELVADVGVLFGLATPWTAFASEDAPYETLLPWLHGGFVSADEAAGTAPRQVEGLALEPTWIWAAPQAPPVWGRLYGILLESMAGPVRVCYERRAAMHPELAGVVTLNLELRPDGSFKKVEAGYSSLGDQAVVACILRAVRSLRFPPPPPGAPLRFAHRFRFESHLSWSISKGCSKASAKYLSVRRRLWDERLSRGGGSLVDRAVRLWHEAAASCELPSWIDKKALLEVFLRRIRRTELRVRLYHALSDRSAKAYLRRRILASLRTRRDVLLAVAGLWPNGLGDWALVKEALAKARSVRDKLAVVHRFLAYSPNSLGLERLGFRLAASAGLNREAERFAWKLRRHPACDVATRLEVGRFLLKGGRPAAARRAMGEVVEVAPDDPYARRMLARAYLEQGWCRAAGREFRALGRLVPSDPTARMGRALADLCAGRLDQAARRLAEVAVAAEIGDDTGPAAAARALLSLLLARVAAPGRKATPGRKAEAPAEGLAAEAPWWSGLSRVPKDASGRDEWLASWRRWSGQRAWAGRVLVALEWATPGPGLTFRVAPAGQELRPARIQMPWLGLAAERFRRKGQEAYLQVELRESGPLPAPVAGWVTVLSPEAGGRLQVVPFRLTGKERVVAFQLEKGLLKPTKVRRRPGGEE